MNEHSKRNGESQVNSESTKPGGGISRRDFVKYSAGTVACLYLGALNTGCGGGTTTSSSFPVVVFSDVHFNPFYDQTLFPALFDEDDTDKWAAIFQTSNKKAPSARGGDTNYPLLVLALAGIKQNLGATPLVIYTGDILGHGIAQFYFYPLYYQHIGVTAPVVPDAAAVAAMKAFTDKVVAFFMGQVRSAVGNVPVMFAVGNGDSYTGYGPDSVFLANTAELFYAKFLNGAIDKTEFNATFTAAGYYSAEPAGTNLMVISLNTILFCQLFSSGPTANDSIVAAQLDWLDSRLAAAEVKGKKVWLLMHAPPGADMATTAKPANVDSSGHITTATMEWWPAYQARFLKILSNYPGLLSLTLAGHTHMDEYRMLPSVDALEITPAISPWFGNNPAFKVFTISGDTLKPTDFSSLNCDLANPLQFNSYYTFSTAYSSQGLLGESLRQLTPALVTNSAKQALYRGYYFSGNNSLTPVTYPPFGNSYTPITDTTWPVYWSGIGHMEESDIVTSVNNYPS